MVSAIKLLGSSIDRAISIETQTVAKAGLSRRLDTPYQFMFDVEDFPRRDLFTEWFWNPMISQFTLQRLPLAKDMAASE